jgi:two-component system, sensor histidine kinase and response regulator
VADPITETTATDCLLVIDNQEANIQVLGSMLGKLGFEILPAADSAQAFRRLNSRRPDLILLDLMMPNLDGFEICRRIQENPAWAEIPIIFLSASDDKNLIVRALESGGVDYITKPFNKLELISRVRTHLMLKTARDHLKRLAEDKEELIGMISHHLQNHLAGMQMSAQLLQNRLKAEDDPKVRMLTENIQSSSSQMRSFLRTFLANAAAGHSLKIKLEPVSLADAAVRAIKQYDESAKAKGIVIRSVIPSEAVTVFADSAALDQVLDNLISNAVKFSPPGKEISVTVQRGLMYMECQIRDQGAGFTDADKKLLFQRYARLSARPTAGEPSTGLGLSIAKKLMQAMNGELNCDSKVGEGSTFVLRLPGTPGKGEN